MLAKKLKPESVSVTIEEGKLSVIIRDETGQQEYDLTTQLYGPIVAAESRWELLSTKVSETCVSWPRNRFAHVRSRLEASLLARASQSM